MEMQKLLNINEHFKMIIGLNHRALWYLLTDNTSLIFVRDYKPCSVCGVKDPGNKHKEIQ